MQMDDIISIVFSEHIQTFHRIIYSRLSSKQKRNMVEKDTHTIILERLILIYFYMMMS